MSNVDEGNLDGFERAVVVEIEACEWADTELVVDVHAGVNFFAGVAIGFEAIARFKEFDLIGVF